MKNFLILFFTLSLISLSCSRGGMFSGVRKDENNNLYFDFKGGQQVVQVRPTPLVDDVTVEVNADDEIAVKDGGITAPKLANESVTAAKIANLAVTSGKIANLAVTSGKIASLAVTSGNIANLAVGTSKLADEAVTSGKLAVGAVDQQKIQVNSIDKQRQSDVSVVGPSGGNGQVVYSSALNATGSLNCPGLGPQNCGAFLTNTATLNTTGRPIMVKMAARFGNGPIYFRCGKSGNHDLAIILDINSGSGFMEVARWTYDFNIVVGPAGFQNLHDFYRSYTYFDGRVATTGVDYRYRIFATNAFPNTNLCQWNNLSIAVVEL